MRKNNCEEIRRQLDELMLDEQCKAEVSEHLSACSECREFHRTQTKLRQVVGSLGTVEAPADFESRLRARLANDSNSALPFGFAYWSFARGLAVASVLIVLAAGAVLLRNIMDQPARSNVAEQNPPPVPAETPRAIESPAQVNPQEFRAEVPESTPQRIRNERPVQPGPRVKRQLSTVDFSSERPEVISTIDSTSMSGVFPIDASLQSLRVSLDDGRGNAKTISVPAISFGSQRTLTSGNQFTQKGSW